MLCLFSNSASERFSCFNGFCSFLGRHVSRLLKTPSLGLFECLRSPLRFQIFSIWLTSSLRLFRCLGIPLRRQIHSMLSTPILDLFLVSHASRSACLSLRSSGCGNVSLRLFNFKSRALLELWKRLNLSFYGIIFNRYFLHFRKIQYCGYYYFYTYKMQYLPIQLKL